jgi:hypothetical protein
VNPVALIGILPIPVWPALTNGQAIGQPPARPALNLQSEI